MTTRIVSKQDLITELQTKVSRALVIVDPYMKTNTITIKVLEKDLDKVQYLRDLLPVPILFVVKTMSFKESLFTWSVKEYV